MRSLPEARANGVKLGVPSAARVTLALPSELAKSAAVTAMLVPATVEVSSLLSHQAFVPAVSLPIVLSLCESVVTVQNETLLVNTAEVIVELSPNLKLDRKSVV